jgi:hypothetical protein
LHGTHHDRPGIFDECLERRVGLLGVIDVADRLREPFRAQSRYLIEGKVWACGNDQIVIWNICAVGKFNAVLGGMNAFRAMRMIVDPLSRHDLVEVDFDFIPLAPADGDPGIGGDEVIAGTLSDHGQPVARSENRHDFVGHQRSAKSSAQNHHFSHDLPPSPKISLYGHGTRVC